MNERWICLAAMLCLAVAGCGPNSDDQAHHDPASEASATPTTTFGAADERSEGEIAFLQCAACHAVTMDDMGKTGPDLLHAYNQFAGRVSGYEYSEAMAGSEVVWDRETLSAFLSDPGAVVPGTKMIFAGIEDEAERAVIVDYLEQIMEDSQ